MGRLCGRLIIRVESASDLPDSDSGWCRGASDPYCIVRLGDTEIARTKVLSNESNPVWDEEVLVNVNSDADEVKFEVWDSDEIQPDDLLGTVTVPVDSINNSKSKKKPKKDKKGKKDKKDKADKKDKKDKKSKKEKKPKKDKGEKEGDLRTESLIGGPNSQSVGKLSFSILFREFGGEIQPVVTEGATKRSLHIGINYVDLPKGKGQLRGCYNDIETLHNMLTEKYGWPADNARFLRDDDPHRMPTRQNITNAIKWLVADAKAGDSLVFQYSGHGGQVADEDGDEEDAKDETIIPCDYRTAGQITDDELFKLLVSPLEDGVMMTIIMDCCHSGTGMDLPYVHKIDTVKTAGDSFAGFKEKKKKKDKKEKKPKKDKKDKKEKKSKRSEKEYDDTTDANVVMFSGCLDCQTSSDAVIEGKPTGAMTYSFTKAIGATDGDVSYEDLLKHMHQILHEGNYVQVPQLSTARPFALTSKFNI